MKDIINRIINELLDFIYPDNIQCILCNKPINMNNTYSMCKSCFLKLHFIKDGCMKCGKSDTRYSLEEYEMVECSYCKGVQFYFDRAISCIEYTKLSKKIIFNLKYKGKTYLSKSIAGIMKDKLEIEGLNFDYIMYVPLHKKRFNERGFNQSQKIAKYLSETLNKPLVNSVDRVSNTTKLYNLSKEDRKKELKNAFVVNDEVNLKGKNVIIVDDIFTTGSTVNEISKKLKLEGVNKIYIITFLSKNK